MRLWLVLYLTCLGYAENYELEASLDPFLKLPGAYQITPSDLTKAYQQENYEENPYFSWLDEKKTRAIFKKRPASNVFINLTILEKSVPVDEMIVDFKGGKFQGCTISVFNRGDSGTLDREEFKKRVQAIGKHVSKQLDSRAKTRTENKSKGVLTSGYVWKSSRGIAALEYNEEAKNGKAEFVRLRLARKGAEGVYAAAMNDRSTATVRKSSLKELVTRDGNATYIKNIPMVDQGAKGYCVVASVQRLFEYYGISCDMHQLAELAGSDPKMGTSTLETNKQLGKIDFQFKTRYTCLAVGGSGYGLTELKDGKYVGDPIPQKDFERDITRSIDKGIPLLWSLQLGIYSETPPLNEQTSGGHMRLIIGYDLENRLLFFSDSWGAGHEKKSMSIDDAYKCTSGLYSMVPTTN